MVSLRTMLAAALLAAALACVASAPARAASAGAPVAIGTADPREWKAVPADGVALAIGSEGSGRDAALQLAFDFHGGGGYAVAHRAVALDLPANYRFRFRIKGDSKPNTLEFKLIDASGENVWWRTQRDFEFTPEWREVSIRARDITFAWGPLGGGKPGHIAALEFAVTAGQGGKGHVEIADLRLEPLPPPDTTAHAIAATASSGGRDAARAVDGDAATAWRSAAGDHEPWLRFDLGAEREFGGIVLDWQPGAHARDYVVRLSSDARTWRDAYRARGADGGSDPLPLPESEARYVRLEMARPAASDGVVALRELRVMPLAWGATRNDFYKAVATAAPRGWYPRATLGEMTYWTVIGADADPEDALVDEYGRIEPFKGGWSLEPFVRDRGALRTWADAQVTPALREGQLPVPVIEWRLPDALRLTVTACAVGVPGNAAVLARYRLSNDGDAMRTDTLVLAIRPFQVNPPSQFLNTQGGFAPIHEIRFDGRIALVDGAHGVSSLASPAAAGGATFDQGDVPAYLSRGEMPPAARVIDASGRASGALAYPLTIGAHESHEIAVLVPLHDAPTESAVRIDEQSIVRYADELQRGVEARWRQRLNRVTIDVPDTDVVHTLKAQLAYVLVNRAGRAIQPGSRSYARSWIRDGCLTSSALLRLGETQAVRDFIEWFAPYQYANGKAPCCVDTRGADPTPEHDSSGELIYLITEYYRYTGDRAFADTMWPRVAAAAAYLDTLRAQRLTPEFADGESAKFRGLLPPSISHEGYSAKPMHSYWDDFFALRGYKDAAFLAGVLGKPERAALARTRDAFQADLVASIARTMQEHHIDYVPGCADLGDFDATSTSIGLTPADAAGVLPKAALEATWERYWNELVARRDGTKAWDAYTPYEWRNVGAMVRLGWRDRAYQTFRTLMADRRPLGFQHWAEVVWRDPRAAHFIGDMPHTWVGTDHVRSVLDMLAYEREADSSLVIGAGVPTAWLFDKGVTVKDLHTRWGAVSFAMRSPGLGTVAVQLDSTDLRVPPGGIVVNPPLNFRPAEVTLDGVRLAGEPATVTVKHLPAQIAWFVEDGVTGTKPAPKPKAKPRRSVR